MFLDFVLSRAASLISAERQWINSCEKFASGNDHRYWHNAPNEKNDNPKEWVGESREVSEHHSTKPHESQPPNAKDG